MVGTHHFHPFFNMVGFLVPVVRLMVQKKSQGQPPFGCKQNVEKNGMFFPTSSGVGFT